MNKLKFIKGLKKITLAILFAFTGPVLIYMSFQNKGHDFYYRLLLCPFYRTNYFWIINIIRLLRYI